MKVLCPAPSPPIAEPQIDNGSYKAREFDNIAQGVPRQFYQESTTSLARTQTMPKVKRQSAQRRQSPLRRQSPQRSRIIQSDCIDTMRRWPDEWVHLVVADPPYFNVLRNHSWDCQWTDEDHYLEWTSQWIDEAMRLLVPGGLLYCFGQVGKREHVMLHLMSKAATNWQFHDLVVWDRLVGYHNRKDSFTPAHEMILVLRKDGEVPRFNKDAVREPYPPAVIAKYARDKRYKNVERRVSHLRRGKYATNIWRVPSLKGLSKEKVGHPSQKPEEVIRRIVQSSTHRGDWVLDPFLGSGTTAVVARSLRRRWLGIERDPQYYEMARTRMADRRAR